jgi:hypothetical protein
MTPGATMIKRCPACRGSVAQRTVASGNTFGATQWTDGKREAPMLPETPKLVRCPHCQTLLWIGELEQIGSVGKWESFDVFPGAKDHEVPSLDDLFALLDGNLLDPDKQRYVRMRALWTGNDGRRLEPDGKPLPDRERWNLEALAATLPGSVDDALLLKAEVLRELGRFDEARELLDRPIDDRLSVVVQIIRDLIEKRDACVREMTFNALDQGLLGTHFRNKRNKKVLLQLDGHCRSLERILTQSTARKEWNGQFKVVLHVLRTFVDDPDAHTITTLVQRLEEAREHHEALGQAVTAVREWTGRALSRLSRPPPGESAD